ncbi:hypothetical protein BD414DRAFT_412488 [Trametes punicea]|nr:hypothetical protein BD414DRAFT_412488 [Trametes punicea]
MSAAPWDIYAEQLKNLQYGYPLWVPDPAPQLGPVQLGDVGWIRQGEFIPLFNAFRAAEDAQPWDSVPAQFMPLDTRSLSFFGPREKIGQTLLCSSSIKQREGSASVSAGNNTPSFPSADLAFSFRCRDDAGAVLLLSPSAMSYDVLGEGAIKDYIASNFDGWFRFATEVRQLPLREKDIRFVIGTTKSIRWAVAAFRGRYRNRDGALTGALGALPGSANLSFTISNQSLPSTHWRIGPPTRINGAQDNRGSARIEAAGSTAIETHDQCLFIHSVKAKRRIIPRFLKAGAGPHELPRNFKDPASRQTLSTGDWDDESASEDELSSAHDEASEDTHILRHKFLPKG